MSNYMSADPDVRITDTVDAEKTAAGGWAASPAAVASAAAALSRLIYRLDVGDHSVSFKFKSIDGLRSTFVLISIDQSAGICLNSLVVYLNDGSNSWSELNSKGLSISNIVTSKSGDIFTVDITYDKYSVWGVLYVIPTVGATFIGQ